MPSLMDAVDKQLTNDSPSRVARLALSIGWLAKGAVFLVIGMLALEIARRGHAAEDADQTGALTSISSVVAGRIVVFVIAVGLLCYSLWQLWSAIGNDMRDPVGVARRIGWVGLAITYGLLAHTALVIALEGGSSDGGGGDGGPTSPTGVAVRLFEVPGGRLVVATIGIGAIAVGLYNAWKGISGDHLDDIETSDTAPWHRTVLRALGVAGFAARGLLLLIAGWLLIDAARRYDPERAAGIDDSLHELSQATFGTVLLVATGLGLMAAGLQQLYALNVSAAAPDNASSSATTPAPRPGQTAVRTAQVQRLEAVLTHRPGGDGVPPDPGEPVGALERASARQLGGSKP